MWDGIGGGGSKEQKEDESKNSEDAEAEQRRLAASALAAFGASPAGVDAARLQYYEQQQQQQQQQAQQQRYPEAYDYPMSQLAAQQAASHRSLALFPSHAAVEAVENLRRQEEAQMRQRALFELQQRQVLQRQELQELEYARQIQQQRVAELVSRSGHSLVQAPHQQQQQGMSILEAIGASSTQTQFRAQSHDSESTQAAVPSSEASGKYLAIAPRGKPEAMATAIAAAGIQKNEEEQSIAFAAPSREESTDASTKSAATKKSKKRKASSPGKSRKKAATSSGVPTVEDYVPPITDIEYENVKVLMEQFCKVPLLSEFSRPVSLLHPELTSKYSKIVSHPIDLGHVCRAIFRRQYKNTRAIQLDMWRIFANCIKYHTSPSNKDNAVPSFVSIALHLRDYFNALWQEYMVPSDPPASLASKPQKSAAKIIFSKRDQDRKNRIATTSATMLSIPCLRKTAAAILRFIDTNGRVDKLDADAIFDNNDIDDDGDMDEVVDNLWKLQKRLIQLSQTETEEEYNVNALVTDLRRCYMGDLFESKPSLRIRVGHRIDRLMGKIIVNIFEANSRGVNQSSIWGCMAAAIWARESSKKPYWPALVLGIMAPEDQTEEWHASLTERNERRLPEKLLTDLNTGKRKAELAIRRQNEGKAEQCSYFLVEFMGTHEFIWVKESDMIETFDPDTDPNKAAAAGNITKKKRNMRSADVLGSETFATAMDEGRWALEEFELQLNDTCGDMMDEEEDEEQESGYSYAVLCQSDDEADGEDKARHSEIEHEMTFSEAEEANELLASDGLLDFSAEGRKMARKRAAAMKKKKAEEDKATGKKTKKGKPGRKSNADHAKEERREQRELERRRKKRTRERERALKEDSKKRRLDDETPLKSRKRNPIAEKSGRASAVAKAYLMGVAKKEDMKPLGLSGVMTIPSAQIDSTGLLGMALAFRAAAGELDMPERGSGETVSRAKPWESIDVDGPVSTKEREEALLKQKLLLESEIKRIKAATEKRKELKEAALVEKQLMEEEVAANDRAVRLSLAKKSKKKPTKKAALKVEEQDAPGDGTEKATEAGLIVAEFVDANNDEGVPVESVQVAVAVDEDEDNTDVQEAQPVEAMST